MIGMLIFSGARGQDDARTQAAQDRREGDRVRHADFEMRVSRQLDELDRRAEQGRAVAGLENAVVRPTVRRRLTTRADDEMRGVPGARLLHDDTAAPELDVVRMS